MELNYETVKNFKIHNYIEAYKVAGNRKFRFSDADIKKLPLIYGIIDLRDSGLEDEDAEGAQLVLRLSKTKKAFYPVINGRMGTKLGDWMTKPKSNHMPKGFFNTSGARKELYKRVKQAKLLSRDAEHVSKLTIKEYAESLYSQDRERKPLKNGKFFVPTDQTLSIITNMFPKFINKKIRDVSEKWPFEFKQEWEKRGITSSTMRRYYSAINGMINICVSMRYIENNPLDNHYYLFPENDRDKEINIYDWDYFEVIDFIFSNQFDEYYPKPRAANPEGKIIIATCIVAGIRPIEARRNFAENYDEKSRVLWIPAGLQRKTKTGRRMILPHDQFWNAVSSYKNDVLTNNDEPLMFPSNNTKTGYISESKYRFHWEAVRRRFDLNEDDLLYHNRHTFSTKVRETPGGKGLHASVIGDSVETTDKFYGGNTSKNAEKVIRQMYEDSKKSTIKATVTPMVAGETNIIVDATSVGMPDSVKNLFETYKNGKPLPAPDKMYKEQWDKFVSIVKQISESKTLEGADMWLLLQD